MNKTKCQSQTVYFVIKIHIFEPPGNIYCFLNNQNECKQLMCLVILKISEHLWLVVQTPVSLIMG
jgi:hypothetical protein